MLSTNLTLKSSTNMLYSSRLFLLGIENGTNVYFVVLVLKCRFVKTKHKYVYTNQNWVKTNSFHKQAIPKKLVYGISLNFETGNI